MVANTEQKGAVSSIYNDVSAGWEKWNFFTSDVHLDSIYCNRDLFIKHMDEAKKRNANIFVFGDLLDAMQGRFDPRRSMAELRPEYRREDYYDFVVKDASAILAQYADNIVMLADGNHELSVLKAANTNLTDRIVSFINLTANGKILHGGYGGWVRFMFNLSYGNSTGPRTSIKLKYFHGSGGEAPVTKGAINAYRQMTVYPDADIIWNGHSHNEYVISSKRERISTKGSLYYDINLAIRTPGYKDDYQNGMTGWEVERQGSPKPQGAVWVKLSFDGQRVRAQAMEDIE